MAKKSDNQEYEKITTTLGKETVFRGTMRFKKSLKIDGDFEGRIESSGFLFIEDGAKIKADIKVNSIIVGGIVYGNIIAKERLEMLSTGKVYGNIKTAKLKIADGVVFKGKCEMIKNNEGIDIFKSPLSALKTSLSNG
jgi:cytoskeletal protein CcmA (bactofilin family)